MQQKMAVISGLPGSGKSTLAEQLSRTLALPVFSVDPVEAAIWRGGLAKEDTGIAAYEVVGALADEHLKLGYSVIIDAVSPVEAPRTMWRTLVQKHHAHLIIIECICSDSALHKRRIENRNRAIPGMAEVTWERVEQRRKEYEPWQDTRLILDSARDAKDLFSQAMAYVQQMSGAGGGNPCPYFIFLLTSVGKVVVGG